jgi:small subunit ribosomal protein S25
MDLLFRPSASPNPMYIWHCHLSENGQQKTLDLHEKWLTTILKELMEVAGGDPWFQWKTEAKAAGLPVVPGEENESKAVKRPPKIRLPSLQMYRASVPPPATTPTPTLMASAKTTPEGAAPTETKTKAMKAAEVPIPPPRLKNGAAAVLP